MKECPEQLRCTIPTGAPIQSVSTVMCTNINSDLVDGLHASQLVAATSILSAYKTGDQSSSSTTLADDSALSVSLAASTKYAFEITLFVSAASAVEGFKCALSGTCGVGQLKTQITIFDDVSNAMAALDRVTAFAASVGAGLSLGNAMATMAGTIEVSTAGTFLVQWAQNAGIGAAATTVQRGSVMEVQKL